MIVTLEQAIEQLHQGGVCAVPTETVYGLAARFDDENAVRQIFAIKQRPLDHPLIVHIANQHWLHQLTQSRPAYVDRLIAQCWPGPLTMVLNKTDQVSPLITANQPTVAIRWPSHPLLQQLLQQLDRPIVAPSANRFCQTSPTTAAHVLSGLGDRIAVLDGGACDVGIESTIVLATDPNQLTLLRPGMIAPETLAKIASVPCVIDETCAVKTAGQHEVHYQPKIPLYIIDPSEHNLQSLAHSEQRFGCMLSPRHTVDKRHRLITMPEDASAYAKVLYHHWQCADQLGVDALLIELPAELPAWLGIRDRIIKASHGYWPSQNR